MKNLKKTFALALCLVLALSLFASASAANYTITVTGAQAGETYSIYKMLDLSVDDATNPTAFTYTGNSAWTNFFTNSGEGTAYFDVDSSTGAVTWKTSLNGQEEAKMPEVAKKAADFAADTSNSISATATQEATSDSVAFNNLDSGYYLITSTNGMLAMVDTTPTNPTQTIAEKNEDPTLTKTIDDGEATEKTTSYAQIGDAVEFTATIAAKKGAKNYVYHETLGAGFTLQDSTIAVKVGGSALTAGTDYTLTTDTTGLTDGCTFEIAFKQDYLDKITDPTDIVITYSAKLDDDAVVGDSGNKTTAHLTWGANGETVDAITTTYTFAASVFKYTMKDTAETALAGAKFTLSESQDGTNPIKFLKDASSETYKIAADQTNANAVGEITTTAEATGKFTLQGLDAGEYYLTETAAPAGYNRLAGAIKVVVTGSTDGTATIEYYNYDAASSGYPDAGTNVSTTDNQIKVQNNAGVELPSTGGVGTTVFYVMGGVLVAAAVTLLVTKKRARRQG